MKKLIVSSTLIVCFFSISVFAQTPSPTPGPADVFASLLGVLDNIPYVGPVLSFIAKWGGLVAGIFTALTVAAQTILTLPEMVARWAGAHPLADKIKQLSDEVLPWFKYLSMFNAQPSGLKAKVLSHEKQLGDLWFVVRNKQDAQRPPSMPMSGQMREPGKPIS